MLLVWRPVLDTKDTLGHQLYQEIMYNDTIPDKQKCKIVMVFSEIDKRLVDGADEHLAVLDLALRISGFLAES